MYSLFYFMFLFYWFSVCYYYLLIWTLSMFLLLDLRQNSLLLTLFAQLTCLVYYTGCWVSLYLDYSANEGIALILVQQTFHATAHNMLFGYRCLPYYLASIVYLTFPFDIYTGHKLITCHLLLLHYCHTFSLMLFPFNAMYLSWCLTLYQLLDTLNI